MEFMIHLIRLSGGLPIIMAMLLLIALTVVIERLWFYLRVLGAGQSVEKQIREAGNSVEGLKLLSNQYGETLQGGLIRTAIHSKSVDLVTLDRLLDEQIMSQMPSLDRSLWILDTAVTLGPLLGLLGTIIGMIQTFNVLGSHGAAIKATGGIADALVATGLGLFIAIVSVTFLNFFNKRLRVGMHQLDLIRVMLINALDGKSERSPAMGQARNHYESLSAESSHLGRDDLRGAEGV